MTCMICLEDKETRFIPLYIMGSEGTHICHECEMEFVEFAHKLMRDKLQIKKEKTFPKKQYAVRIKYVDPDESQSWESIDPILINAVSHANAAKIIFNNCISYTEIQEIRVNNAEDEDNILMGQGYYFQPKIILTQV